MKTRSQEKNVQSDVTEVRNMVMYFRSCELHDLLGTSGGRKGDLQQKALELIDQRNQKIIDKVREIYKTQTELLRANINPSAISSGSVATTTALSSHLLASLASGPHTSNTISTAIVRPTQQQIMNHQQHIPVVDPNRATIHTNGVVVSPYQYVSGFPVHPDVRLKKLAFFDVLATLLKPSTLVPNNPSNRVQEGTFYFHLTPQQATDIAINRDIRNGSKIEHTIQVQLRFCLLETSCEQEDYFPPNVVVKVNNKVCTLPNPIPTNKPGVEPKRPPRPVNVTQNVKLSPTVPNHISISWCCEFNRAFVISVYLVRKLTSAQLLHRLKTKGVKPADFTRGLIKEKLNEDADSEIATTMLKVSLICPLGKMRMSTPCRASTCSHLQCFDASLYLQMNERKPTWNCPVCDKPGLYENLVVDGYFQEVLASSMLNSDDSEIQLHKDGSWSTHIMRNDTQVLDTPNKSVAKVEVILDDLEMVSSDPPKTSIKTVGSSNINEPSSTTTETVVNVDLTLSDSDDDDLPLKRKIPAKANTNNVPSKPKANENMSSSIISVDSPSPPSSPNPPEEANGGNGQHSSNNVTSSTTPNCQIPDLNPLNGAYQINPLAINRNDNLNNVDTGLPDAGAYQRLYTNPPQNWNIVHPFRQEFEENPK